MKKRVVVTGLGSITPIGLDTPTYWNNLKNGVCGLSLIESFDTTDYKAKVAGEIKNFDEKNYMDRKEARRMDRFSQFAVAAAKEAIEDSGLNLETIDKYRAGVIVSSGIGGLGTIETENQKLVTKGPNRVTPMLIPLIITNMAAGNIAIQYGFKGTCKNVVTACASGTHSIGDAMRSIQYGEADIMLAGGTESSITPLGVAGFAALTALSFSSDPLNASKPFDKNRDGFVMGEGAGVVVLESLEHALARGAKIYAEVTGYGSTCDAYHITSPADDAEGGTRAMQIAMAEAGITGADVSYINAHGTSTPVNDRLETKAIKQALGEAAYKVAVSSTKSMTGHLLGAAGGVEFVACCKSIEEDFVHPTIGFTEADPDCDLDIVPNVGRAMTVNHVLTNSLGFGGHNATLCLSKYKA